MQGTSYSSILPQRIINVPGTGSATPPSGSDNQNSVGGDSPEVDLKDPYAAQQQLGAKSAKGERCAVTVEAATTATAVDALQTTHCIAQVKVIADEGFNAEQFAAGLANNDSVLAVPTCVVGRHGRDLQRCKPRKSFKPVTLTLVGCSAANPERWAVYLLGAGGGIEVLRRSERVFRVTDVVHGYSRGIGPLKLHLTSSEPLESCTSLVKELMAFNVSGPHEAHLHRGQHSGRTQRSRRIPWLRPGETRPDRPQQAWRRATAASNVGQRLRYAVKALGAHVAPQLIGGTGRSRVLHRTSDCERGQLPAPPPLPPCLRQTNR